jgi:hypothetical protein
MNLFALLGVPSFALLAFSLDRWLNPATRRDDPAARLGARAAARLPLLHLLWGFLYAIPCFFLARLLARIFPDTYRPFLLFLQVLGQNHLFQVGFLALAGFSFLREAGFRELGFFGAGYLSLIGFAGSLSTAGVQDAYPLFLLPAARMATLVLWPMLFARQRERNGLERILFLVLLALIPLVGALIGWLFARNRMVWAGIGAAAFLAGALGWLVYGHHE